MTANSPDLMKQATNEAMDDPQVGDRFSAKNTFWVFWVLVVHRAGEKLVTIEGCPPLRFPGEGTFRAYSSLEKFKKWFSDDTVSAKGYLVRLVDRGHNVQGWYSRWNSPENEMRAEGVVSIPSTNKYHPYHMNCFLSTHEVVE